MPTRYDVSKVPPLGAYPARQCPVRVQWDTIRPGEARPPSPALARRFARGIEFEREVMARLLAEHPGAGLIPAGDRGDPDEKPEREAATLRAMRAGQPLIIGGRLPADVVGRRVGEPDLLVATAAGARYRPVDVKHHRTLLPSSEGLPARCSDVGDPRFEASRPLAPMTARRRAGDLLQLAHYQRMLETAGLAAADGRFGGIVGAEGVVTWFDLDAPCWLRPSSSGGRRSRSTMEVYDFEFDFRLDIVAVATMHLADQQVEPLVVPVRVSECEECPWWSWCGPYLSRGSGDVSLVPGVGWRAWRVHRDHGVTDRSGLAALDHRTAALVAAGVDVRPALTAIGSRPAGTPIEEIIRPRRAGQIARLRAAGIRTLADARKLCPVTASYSDAPMRGLPEQIDLANAALGKSPAYRRRGVDTVRVPRGDVEIDIDMENTDDGVYLWGALVTDRSRRHPRWAGYRAFTCWAPMTSSRERRLFTEFWQWLTSLRNSAVADGLSLRAYCYNAAAEAGQLRRIAAGTDAEDEVAALTGSADWIDLMRTFADQVITGGPIGLKNVATLPGFRWEVADPGGDTAVINYDAAVGNDQQAADAAIAWLLSYNECDVRAVRAVRDWLDTAATGCPSIAGA